MDILRARLNMIATVIRGGQVSEPNTPDPNVGAGAQGWHYEWKQDPDSGAIIQVKITDTDPTKIGVQPQPQNGNGLPNTSTFNSSEVFEIECMARGVIDGGIRVAGTTEVFSKEYNVADHVKITFPADTIITRRDQITNIRHRENDLLIWVEEESGGAPTIFNVQGVTPVVDPFGNHIENFALLERRVAQ